ncbi:MAG: hypothetical protein K6E18_03580 [Lachnospiraceae bacterium]|nr:hypothetical protein [Lachnospiraceae bacterium]
MKEINEELIQNEENLDEALKTAYTLPPMQYGEESMEAAENKYDEFVNLTKDDIYSQVTQFKTYVAPCFTEDQAYLSSDPTVNKDIDEIEAGSKLNKAFSVNENEVDIDFKDEKVFLPTENATVKLVANQKHLKTLKADLKNYLEQVDDTLTTQFYDPNDEAASELTMGFLKANGLGSFNRMLNGHTNTYLAMHTPMVDAVGGLTGTINAKFDSNLPKRLIKNESYYPIISVINKAEEHLQTLSDYWMEKDAGDKSFDKVRIGQYRQKLYAQANEMLPLIDKMSGAAKNMECRDLIKDSKLHSSGNEDPFHNALEADRGALQLKCTLQAHMAGLENGWDINDLGILAAFHFANTSARNKCKKLNITHDFSAYESADHSPEYKEGQEQYLNDLDTYWTHLQKSPVTDARDRQEKLNRMKAMIDKGYEKGFIENAQKDYFQQMYDNSLARSKKIADKKEPACYDGKNPSPSNMIAGNEIDMRMFKFDAKRSIIFFGRESDEHEKLRTAVQQLRQIEKDNAENMNIQIDKSEYLRKLDEVLYYSKLYQKEKKDPHTPAGKKRLEGAKKFEAYAKQQRRALMDEINGEKDPEKERTTLEQYRIDNAKSIAQKATNELNDMDIIPQGAGKKAFLENCADILVSKFAAAEPGPLRDGFLTKGANILKKDLLNSKEFNRMMSTYMRSGMSPADIANDLGGDNGMAALKKFSEKIKKESLDRTADLTTKKTAIRAKNEKVRPLAPQ